MSEIGVFIGALVVGVCFGFIAGRGTALDELRSEAVDRGYACYVAPKHGGVSTFKWGCK